MGQKSNIIRKAAGIIISNQELLVERSIGKDFYIAPGGKIEQGESAEQALVRELEEELDIQIKQSIYGFLGLSMRQRRTHPVKPSRWKSFWSLIGRGTLLRMNRKSCNGLIQKQP